VRSSLRISAARQKRAGGRKGENKKENRRVWAKKKRRENERVIGCGLRVHLPEKTPSRYADVRHEAHPIVQHYVAKKKKKKSHTKGERGHERRGGRWPGYYDDKGKNAL